MNKEADSTLLHSPPQAVHRFTCSCHLDCPNVHQRNLL